MNTDAGSLMGLDAVRGGFPATVSGIVTATKVGEGDDVSGFFLQAQAIGGPAVFVSVDPATTTPALSAGDLVTLDATSVDSDVQGRVEVTAIANLSTTGTDTPIDYVEDLSNAMDVVSALDDYEAEYIAIDGTIAGAFGFAGNGYVQAPIDTAGLVGDGGLRLRISDTVRATYPEDNLAPGCAFQLIGVMWRFNTSAQASALTADDLTIGVCPQPTVLNASAPDDTTVVVSFDRLLDGASLNANGDQFTIPGLTVNGAVLDGRAVTLTVSTITPNTDYTVTVANGLVDLNGAGVDETGNTATFQYVDAAINLIFNEINYDDVDGDDLSFVELYNAGDALSLDALNLALVAINGNGGTESGRVTLTGTLPAGGYLVMLTADDSTSVTPDVAATVVTGGPSLQNGAPDAIALYDQTTMTVLGAVTWEGSITTATIDGNIFDLSAYDEITGNNTDNASCRSPNQTGAWGDDCVPSPGSANP